MSTYAGSCCTYNYLHIPPVLPTHLIQGIRDVADHHPHVLTGIRELVKEDKAILVPGKDMLVKRE